MEQRKLLERELDILRDRLLLMGGEVELSIQRAIHALVGRDASGPLVAGGLLARGRIVKPAFGEPHVEVRLELAELGLLLRQLQPVGRLPKRDHLLVRGQLEDAGDLVDDTLGQRGDVLTVVAVLRRLFAARAGHHRGTELVHL